jgi:hypothetical protein
LWQGPLNERFEQYINGKRENLHSNFTLRLKKILWEARSTPTLVMGSNNGLKIYQTTNNLELFYQIIQIIQIIFY